MSAGNILQLDIENKCGDKKEDSKCLCQGGSNIPGLKASKEVDQPTKGFTKYTHSIPGGIFKLSKILGRNGGRIIEVGGTGGQTISGLTEVSVYYWNGNLSKPILLGLTKGSGEPTFYGKHLSFWGNDQVKGLGELDALDDFNCKINDAVVFNITSSQTGSIPNGSNSNCINKYRNITESKPIPTHPPGSNYISKAYMTTGLHGSTLSTRISRVTLHGKSVTFSTPTETIDVITLYSYRASDQVPLMLEFKPPGNRRSRWFESKDSTGKNWIEYLGHSDAFYNGDNDPKPTAKLSEKLDEVLCIQYGNTTLDISYDTSKSGTRNCCEKHKTINFQEMQTKDKGRLGQTKVYKYYINAEKFNLGGIKYYENVGGDRIRKKINFFGQPFPISGVKSLYVFYCSEKPVLIYLDTDSAMAKGWYRKKSLNDDTSEWIRRYSKLSGITPYGLDNISCEQWSKLVSVLKRVGCTSGTCSSSSVSLTRSAVPGPEPGTAEEEDDDEDDPPPVPSALQADAETKRHPTDVDITIGVGGVTIELDSKSPYRSSRNSGQIIDVSPYKSTSMIGYSAYEHTIEKDLKINKFTVESKGQTFIPKISHVKDVSVVVFFTSCTNFNDPATGIPLLAYIGSSEKGHKWYARKEKTSRKWHDISNQLGELPPHKTKKIEVTLKNITKSLGLSCKGKPKRLVTQGYGNEIQDIEANMLPNKNLEHSDNMSNAISPTFPSRTPNMKLQAQGDDNNFDFQRDSDSISTSSNKVKNSVDTFTEKPANKSFQADTHDEGTSTVPDNEVGGGHSRGLQSPRTSLKATPGTSTAQGPASQNQHGTSVPGTTIQGGLAPKVTESQPTSETSPGAPPSHSTEPPKSAEVREYTTPTIASGPPPAAQAEPIIAEGAAAGSVLWTAFGSTSGTLAGAGATFFGGWKLYNRYKGDPWVRQI